jgi:hypothetical protein
MQSSTNKGTEMSKLLISTQVYENYAIYADGSFGVGVEAYWKPKGGNDYFVENIDINKINDIICYVAGQVECDNEGYRETVMSAEVVADDYMTEFERQQLEWDGEIKFPAPTIKI